MKTVVISQPMFFPWAGMLEQLKLADAYVHYDDVQFSKGSFTNRVQIKTAQGSQWLTVPLKDVALGSLIKDTFLDDRKNWRRTHLSTLSQAYARAPFKADMLALVEEVYAMPCHTICELSIASMMCVRRYLGLQNPVEIHTSSAMGIGGSGSPRVLAVVQALGGSVYVTGHGARNYLDHQAFEDAGVSVRYMDYQKKPYPQLHGDFTPFVSTLDLIANCGANGADALVSGTLPWQKFLS